MNGKRLTKLRHERGYTQTQLASLLGLGQNQISRYESDNYNPSVETLIRIVESLDTTADYMLGLSNIPHPGAEPEPDLTANEREILKLMSRLDEALQPVIIDALRSFVSAVEILEERHT